MASFIQRVTCGRYLHQGLFVLLHHPALVRHSKGGATRAGAPLCHLWLQRTSSSASLPQRGPFDEAYCIRQVLRIEAWPSYSEGQGMAFTAKYPPETHFWSKRTAVCTPRQLFDKLLSLKRSRESPGETPPAPSLPAEPQPPPSEVYTLKRLTVTHASRFLFLQGNKASRSRQVTLFEAGYV